MSVNNGLLDIQVTTLAVNNNEIFAGTVKSYVFRSSNHGESWISMGAGFTSSSIVSLAITETEIFAGTSINEVFHAPLETEIWYEPMEVEFGSDPYRKCTAAPGGS
jgi:hypothetical protein